MENKGIPGYGHFVPGHFVPGHFVPVHFVLGHFVPSLGHFIPKYFKRQTTHPDNILLKHICNIKIENVYGLHNMHISTSKHKNRVMNHKLPSTSIE